MRGPTFGVGAPAYVFWRSDDGLLHRLGFVIRGDPAFENAFIHSIQGGLSLLAGAHLSSFAAGWSSSTHLHVPLDRDGVYWIDYRSRDFGTSTIRFDAPSISESATPEPKENEE